MPLSKSSSMTALTVTVYWWDKEVQLLSSLLDSGAKTSTQWHILTTFRRVAADPTRAGFPHSVAQCRAKFMRLKREFFNTFSASYPSLRP